MPRLYEGETRSKSVKMPEELYNKLYSLQKSTHVKMTRFIVIAIENFLQNIETFNVPHTHKEIKNDRA